MALTTRSSRKSPFNEVTTSHAVGPGAYDIKIKSTIRPSYAGFSSSDSRKIDQLPPATAPGMNIK